MTHSSHALSCLYAYLPLGTAVTYGGINIAGFEFGCDGEGNCDPSAATPPGQTGIDQMTHFVSKGLNAFRLPVSWQYLVTDLGNTINASRIATYDKLVQGCVDAGAKMCIVDLHNYARWDGKIIGQSAPSGPTDDQFADLWSQIAKKYKAQSKVAFGTMNEPHNLSMETWVTTVQAAVTAIRNAGATDNIILLPGTNHQAAGGFAENSGGLAAVKNVDGSKTNLVFDVHQYLDSDSTGTHAGCVTNATKGSFAPLATWARDQNRQVFLSETGGGPQDSTCISYLKQTLSYLNDNSDVYLGWTTWAAGSFKTSYVLSETPSGDTDVPLVKQVIIPALSDLP
ncbi:cellulase-domain-containing protein [Mytilinidion resinicola]|uniref:Endoglucanase EG-II n=1 Tax=Mytilinidion resinicola TaxID=574789 RepID=A0A6A6Z4H2_9PEZI|nr:cellulase-domain-containing protein [Mytilinidion resinicola]KAF2815553.1 cellulase-domain-containing protein [Mytilinidion resinicola]